MASVWLAVGVWATPGVAQTQPVARSQAVVVSQAWVRPAVKGQRVTGGYLQIQALQPVTLVDFSSPVAGQTELHDMKMDGDVMRMRALTSLPVGAGQVVTLQPGGQHLMLMDLKKPIARGAQVPLTLRFQDAKGQSFELTVSAVAQPTAPGSAAASKGAAAEHSGHEHHH